MNTKKKHKNRPKPTPAQPQKVDPVVVDEKVEEVVQSEVKEVMPLVVEDKVDDESPVVENLDSGETPKKPKRNKGKKKNQEKENEQISLENLQDVQSEIKTEQDEEEIKDKNENQTTESIMPSVRKKKNKKKPQELVGQQPNITAKEECVPTALEVKESDIQIDAEIKESAAKLEEAKPETKSKKKNKKKKRNDSEKSDKSEEINCTSAFQQLLKDKPSEQKDVIHDITSPTETKSNIQMSMLESMILEDQPKNLAIESIEKIKECKQTPENKEETKSKKKNKKDKKHSIDEQPKEENPVEMKKLAEHKSLMELIDPFMTQSAREPSPKPTLEAIPELKSDTLLETLPSIEKEPSPKPKAKIAKPVEKKRKGLQEPSTDGTENLPTMIEEIVEKDITQPGVSTVPWKQDERKIALEEQRSPEAVVSLETIPVTADTIGIPDQQRRRKKSKSPKPPKSNEKIQFSEDSQNITPIKTEQVSCEHQTDDSKIKESDSGTEIKLTLPKDISLPLQKSEQVDEVPPLVQIDDMNVTKSKIEKKKKKTPKFPSTTDGGITEGAEAKINPLITPEANEFKDIPIPEGQKIESVSEPSVPDMEIQGSRTNESSSSCDVTPIVQFVRSSSFQTLDTNNNNTVIQEVTNVEDLKQTGLTPLPIVERSGETPSKTPDLGVSAIKMTERKSIEKEEPTYLKSKMMEVNQDMEGLRLSIERSLAEFSALEKSEEKAEKDYEPHRLECEKTFEKIEIPTPEVNKPDSQMVFPDCTEKKTTESIAEAPPVCPARKDNKGKSKSKKKGKQESAPIATPTSTTSQSATAVASETKDTKEKQDKTEQETKSFDKDKQQSESAGKGKQQCDALPGVNNESESKDLPENSTDLSLSEQTFSDSLEQLDFSPIDNFEDALTSSVDDVNKTFEMIVNENTEESQKILAANKPEINITAPVDDSEKNKKDEKVNPLSQPKNLLGHHDIPAQSNKIDYKKEKNKTPNERQAKVKIKDSTEVEAKKQSKESQTDAKRIKKSQEKSEKESFSRVKNDNEEYVYKYSFRKVFLQSACHVCHKDLMQVRVPCGYCNLVFYCGAKHKDEDWTQHQALCFAVSTIAHLKDQKHIYADARHISGQEYRLLRMQTIVSCEKVLKRRLVPWEQEAMLYPRICAEVSCREWRQNKLRDCEGCGQISYCIDNTTHLPKSHARWCKSYHLYARLVGYQQTRGRLEPTLPTRGLTPPLADKMNEVLAAMYEERIDMNDIQYAALTQLATAPLTAVYCYQLWKTKMNLSNGVHRRSSFTIHVVGAELQFEADALNKWEVFFLHLRPDVEELRVVLISPVLNPGELPLDLLGKIRLCDKCRQNRLRVVFSFQDKKNYSEYRSSEEFVSPDLVCAFNPSIQRSSIYSGKDPWPAAINCIIKQKVPFIITAHTLSELRKDIARIKECSEAEFRVVSEPVANSFSSVRPDRNFISDDEMPLLFKNYCVSVLCGY